MDCERRMLAIANGDIAVLRKLIDDELTRRIAAIDDIVVAGYGSYIGKRADGNQAALSKVILSLVRSPLADLERKLAVEPDKPAEVPAKVAG